MILAIVARYFDCCAFSCSGYSKIEDGMQEVTLNGDDEEEQTDDGAGVADSSVSVSVACVCCVWHEACLVVVYGPR